MQPVLLSIYRNFLTPRFRYENRVDLVRARVALAYGWTAAIANFLALAIMLLLPIHTLAFNFGIVVTAVSLVGSVAVLLLANSGRVQLAVLLCFLSLEGIALGVLITNGATSAGISITLVALIFAGSVWSWRGNILVVFVNAGFVIVAALLQIQGKMVDVPPVADIQVWIWTVGDIVIIALAGILMSAFEGEFRRIQRSVNRYIAQLRATGEVARITAETDNATDLLNRIVNYLHEQFAYELVQVFMIDKEQRYANLVTSTGEAGQALIQRKYHVSVGSDSAVGQATLKGEPSLVTVDVTSQTSDLGVSLRNELALPLIVENRVIGALVFQTARFGGFSTEEVTNLGLMATQVAVAIRNAQVFDEQKTILNENRRLFLEAEMNLREVERINRRLTGEAWTAYFKTRTDDTVGYTLSDNSLRKDSDWSPVLSSVVNDRQPVIRTEGDHHIVAVPVELRGRPIGAIEVETRGTARQADTLEMLQSIAQRLALSVDNARLFEQAQELAQRELEINSITSRLQSVNDLDEVIRVAIVEMSRVLGAEQASIRLAVNPRLRDFTEHLPGAANSASLPGSVLTSNNGVSHQ